jgi:hypothetical protein
MRFMHLSIVWRDTAKTLDQLRPIFNLADDWVTYGGNNWIIYTSEDILTWHERMRAVINISVDSFVICEVIGKDSFYGWCPRYVVEWLHKPRPSYILPSSGI